MGKMMLGVISYIYIEQAQQYLGGIDGAQAHMKEMSHNIKGKYAIAKSAYETYKAAQKMQKEKEKKM